MNFYNIYKQMLHFCQDNTYFICISISLLILIIIYLYCFNVEQTNEKKIIQSEEQWCIISKEQQILNYSNNFFDFLNVEKDNLWFFLVTELELGEKIMNAMYNNSSFAYNYQEKNLYLFFRYEINCLYVYCWETEKSWESLPIKIFNQTTKIYDKLINSKEYKLPFSGKFVLNDNRIYKIEETKSNGFIVPFLSLKEWDQLQKKINLFEIFNQLPVNYLILDVVGNILYVSDTCINDFNLKKDELFRINDFFNMVRGSIFPETISFNEMKEMFLIKLKSLQEESSILYTLTDKSLQMRLKKVKEYIYMIFENLSDLNVKNNCDILPTDLFNYLSDFIVVVQSDKVIYSNNGMVNINMSANDAKCILSNIGKILELETNNYFYIILNRDIENQINYIRSNISNYMDKIAMLFSITGNQSNLLKEFDIKEYEKYTHYIKYVIDNNLRTLEIRGQKKIYFELFNFLDVFKFIKKQLENILVFKNLIIEINCQENLMVYSHQSTIELLIENLLLLSFQNQFVNKKIKIWRDNTSLICTLDGLPKNSHDLDIFKITFGAHPIISIRENDISIGFIINDKK